ncbi:MAG: hypothetical protein J7M17_01835 [Anaerolineae bacterium]|nr:hypothetical protein [Anaerolineae bacterium]
MTNEEMSKWQMANGEWRMANEEMTNKQKCRRQRFLSLVIFNSPEKRG